MAFEAEAQFMDISNREAPLAMVVNGAVHTFLELVQNGTAGEQQQEERNDPSNTPTGNALIGKPIRKRFGRKYFYGSVSEYEPDTHWYKVTYEDGDSEELEWHELEPLLVSDEQAAAKKRRGGTSTPKSKRMRRTNASEVVVEEKIDLNLAIEQNDEEPLQVLEEEVVIESIVTVEVENDENAAAAATAAAAAVAETAAAAAKPAEKPAAEPEEKEVKGKKRGRKPKAKTEKTKPAAATSKPTQSPAKRAKTQATKAAAAATTPRKSSRLSHLPVPEVTTPISQQHAKKSPASRKPASTGSEKKKQRLSAAAKGKRIQKPPEEEATHLDEKVASSQARGVKLRGRKLKKEFDGKMYRGVVLGYSRSTKYYKIRYEDGDEEELDWKEVEPLLVEEEEAVSSSSAEAGTSAKRPTKRAGKARRKSAPATPSRETRSNPRLRPRRRTSSVS